jgi:beta-lactamase regulating signal transducer with metallopeptidase domain
LRPKDSNAAVLESFRAMKKALRVDATLVTTACVEGPVTIGRTVFWPDGLEQHLSRGEQCQVFRHELAHVRRRDGVRELGWWLLVVTFWFHPLVWWGARRMRAIREQCCDRTVAALPGHCAKTYRQALLQVVRLVHLPAPGLALVDPRAPLAHRLAVLGAGRPARWSGIAALLALATVWPLTGWAERNSNAVAEWVVRPPGSLQLRHMVLERLAQEEK